LLRREDGSVAVVGENFITFCGELCRLVLSEANNAGAGSAGPAGSFDRLFCSAVVRGDKHYGTRPKQCRAPVIELFAIEAKTWNSCTTIATVNCRGKVVEGATTTDQEKVAHPVCRRLSYSLNSFALRDRSFDDAAEFGIGRN